MSKVIKMGAATFVIAIILTLGIASTALAGGDKVHGDKAEGPANQYQETGLPDW